MNPPNFRVLSNICNPAIAFAKQLYRRCLAGSLIHSYTSRMVASFNSVQSLKNFCMKVTLNLNGVVHFHLKWKTTVWIIRLNPRENAQTGFFSKCILLVLFLFFVV